MRLWVLWTQRLQRSSEEFWSLTYREIYACIDDYFDQYYAEQRGWNVRAGTICATIRNANPFSLSRKQWQWTDFFQDIQTGVPAAPGPAKLNETTKLRLRQLASFWKAKRDREGK